jgi:glycosyltransferase involved in cell wall biosynthesis
MPPRLMMTADTVGGVWTYALDLARGIAAVGGETSLVVLGPSPSASQRRECAALPGVSMIETGLSLDWTARSPADLDAAAREIAVLARRLRPDIVHLNSPALMPLEGLPSPVLGACHSCLATWWAAVRPGEPMPADFIWRTTALRHGLAACDALVAPSRSFARATNAAHGIVEPFVVFNGRQAASDTRTERRERLVFTSGRLWDDGKNLTVLDTAAALAAVPLHAAGPLDGPGGERVRPSHARSLGRLSAEGIAEHLRRTPIFASAALYEPFGLGVLEAAQAGCALVLSDIPTFRELWDDAAIFAPPEEPEAFAQAFTRLLADERELRRWGALARARAGRFSLAAMTDGMLDLYRGLGVALDREAAA